MGELSVRLNHNYTVSILDRKNRELIFRDITGKDLEFLDFLLKTEDENIEGIKLNTDQVIKILEKISLDKIDFNKFPPRIIFSIFKKISEVILCNYMTKITWLKACYGIQNGSFMNVLDMEKVPMSKFMAMIRIHEDAIESLNKNDT